MDKSACAVSAGARHYCGSDLPDSMGDCMVVDRKYTIFGVISSVSLCVVRTVLYENEV